LTEEPGRGEPGGGPGATRASDADRERTVDALSAAFAEGRLTREEHSARVERAYGSLTYAELAALSADLPARPQGTPPSPAPTAAAIPRANSLAVASFVCGLIPLLPATLAAIILGIGARRQLRRTGERGGALATAGLALGVFWLLLTVLAVFVFRADVHCSAGPDAAGRRSAADREAAPAGDVLCACCSAA
jgi:hypothetical protein